MYGQKRRVTGRVLCVPANSMLDDARFRPAVREIRVTVCVLVNSSFAFIMPDALVM